MTAVAETTLTTAEADLLAECEATISRGLETFREVGEALMQVRDNRLYRAEFGTFDDYCRERWGLERATAYRAIQAAHVAAILSPIGEEIKNEAQARELAPLLDDPAALRAAHAEAVDRTNGRPTAAAIRDVVRERAFADAFRAEADWRIAKATERNAAINEHNARVADLRKDITPQREAEIVESVRHVVEFKRLSDTCAEFLDRVALVDFGHAVRGVGHANDAPIRAVIDLAAKLQKLLGRQR